jgi:hypothetical protein
MNKIGRQRAVAAALCAATLGAAAKTAVPDDELGQVSGRDGVSILADLNLNIASFTYTDTDANGGSNSLNGIHVGDVMAVAIDIVNQAAFQGVLTGAGMTNVLGFCDGGDVVQISLPNMALANTALLSISMASSTMGGSTASLGSRAINEIDLRGSNVWVWAH